MLPETSQPSSTKLPLNQLLAFGMTGFLAIMTETVPAGLLPRISQGLHISEALAGQLVSLFALGSVVSAVPIINATQRWNRLPLFLLAIGGLLIFNTLTALSNHYSLTLAARFAAGMAVGVIWGLQAGYARRLVPTHLQGRALAIAGAGQPLALCLGVPLGTWLGTLFDWRGVFWCMSALAVILLIWVRLVIPDFPGQAPSERPGLGQVIRRPGIRQVFLAEFAWILAHNVLYTFIAPFLAAAGMSNRVDALLLLFGLASIAGIWIIGLLIDRNLRAMTLIGLLVFTASTLSLGLSHGSSWLVLAGIAGWGLSFGGVPTLLQTALGNTAGDGTTADVAQAMFVTG